MVRQWNIVPQPGQHMAIVGKNGSGKTFSSLVIDQQIIRAGYPLLVIDSKGERKYNALPNVQIIEVPSKLKFRGVEVYRPEGMLNTPEYLDAVLQRAFERKVTLYVDIDEVYQLVTGPRPGPGLANCLMRGRERWDGGRRVRLSIIGKSQRPAWVPRHLFTESRLFLMHSVMEQDRDKMSEYMGDTVKQPIAGHYAWFYHDSMPAPEKILIRRQHHTRKVEANALHRR
jgi:hypothetical protein